MGVSNKNAQENIQPKGNKKPLQVLHISKKDTQKKFQEIEIFFEDLSCLYEVPEEVFYCPLVGYYLGHFYY